MKNFRRLEMSFINECCALIRRSGKDMLYINLGKDGLYYNYYDNNDNIVHRDRLILDMNIDFTKYSFNLDEDDNIYCIHCNNSLNILQCKKNSHVFTQKDNITYNYKKFGINFPYIKYINEDAHVFYYVCNNNSSNVSALFHHYKHNDHWVENKIDFVNHIILDNFTVLWNNAVPTIFYFNLVNGCEEVFTSRFNLGTYSWSEPLQITNSGKNKLYLSAIRDNINFYHICFCESNENGYMIEYLSGYLNENKFATETSTYVNSPSACMYPSLIKSETTLYISWVDFNKLFTVKSDNLGKSWSKPSLDEDSIEEKFSRASFYSNYYEDCKYNVSYVFSTLHDVGILGI